jgi:hypothetical protein
MMRPSTGVRPASELESLEPRLLFSIAPTLPGMPTHEAPPLGEIHVGFDVDTRLYDVPGALGDSSPRGFSYLLHEQWGGAWHDAEKSPSNNDDDLMCWAASSANVLEWTGWGNVVGLETTDDIFAYYNDHWSDAGGLQRFGWEWWFNGENDSQGWGGWSQVETPGGSFYPGETFEDYYHYSADHASIMSTLQTYMQSGYGTGIALRGGGDHAVTVWGVNYNADNPSEFYGVWLTDSDDTKYQEDAPDRLRYYDVQQSGGKWYLQDYYGSNSWYIGEAYGLEQNPNGALPPPEVPMADDYESDDTKYHTKTITPDGAAQERSIHVPSDEDWIEFTLAERRKVTIDIGGDSGDTVLELYDNYARTLLATDDSSGAGDLSQIVRDGSGCLEAGTYYLRVTEDGQDEMIANYTLSVTTEAPDGPMVKNIASGEHATYTDDTGDDVLVRLMGAGSGVLTFNNTGTVLQSIVLSGTDASSKLYISAAGDGNSVGSIDSDGSMAGIYGYSTDLVGSGISLSGGTLGNLFLRNIADGADVSAAGTGAVTTRVMVEQVGAADLTFGTDLSLFSAYAYTGGTLTADSIGNMTIRANAGLGLNGDFGANLSITGSNAQGHALRSMRIMGAASGDWTLSADVYSMRVGSTTDTWSLASTGDVNVLVCENDLNGLASANAFNVIRVMGDMPGDLTTTGVNAQGYSVKLLTVAGSASGTWTLGDEARALKAATTTADWRLQSDAYIMSMMTSGDMNGAVQAGAINIIRAQGDMAADVTLTGNNAPGGLSLRSGMADGVVSGTWDITGMAHLIRFGNQANGWSLNASDINHLSVGTVTDANVTVTGHAGNVRTGTWSAGAMQVGSVRTLATAGDFRAGLNVTGNGVDPGSVVIYQMKVTGAIQNTTFSVSGNVGSMQLSDLNSSSILLGCNSVTGDINNFGGAEYGIRALRFSGGVVNGSTIAAYSIGHLGFDADAGESAGVIQYSNLGRMLGGESFSGTTYEV